VKGAGQTSGIIPFIRVMDSLTLAISQGSLRRGSAAVYLDIHHPEIEEFLEIRKPSGDFNRKSLNLHHGISITDEFMDAVRDGAIVRPALAQDQRSRPRSRRPRAVAEDPRAAPADRRALPDLLRHREPRHAAAPARAGPEGRQSNLCSEIMLHTGKRPPGHRPHRRLLPVSVNAETFLEWRDDRCSSRTSCASSTTSCRTSSTARPTPAATAAYAAMRERSVGLGLMGFHSFLQSRTCRSRAPWPRAGTCGCSSTCAARPTRPRSPSGRGEGPVPGRRRSRLDGALLAQAGHRPDRLDLDHLRRHQRRHRADPGQHLHPQDPVGLVRGQEPLPGEAARGEGPEHRRVWGSILENEGSVQHLDFLSQDDKDVYKTAFELDQRWVVELAADRTPEICQSQSVNIFLPGDVDKWDLHMLHWQAWERLGQAWERGVKSLYYLRSKSVQRASYAGSDERLRRRRL
jgi:ribonucleoside-diphosphate reductase alpha chain